MSALRNVRNGVGGIALQNPQLPCYALWPELAKDSSSIRTGLLAAAEAQTTD